MIGDNKIEIPWYRRNVKSVSQEEDNITTFPTIQIPRVPQVRPKPPEPIREPVPEPVKEPSRVPSKVPTGEPTTIPNFGTDPLGLPFPKDFPLPIPFPKKNPQGEGQSNNPFKQPIPSPLDIINWDVYGKPVEESNIVTDALKTILEPIITIMALKQISDKYVSAKITNPVYNRMREDPVLGLALREAEKANLDMEVAANYFVNYDYDNFNAEQMTKDLTALFGAVAAARIIVFFMGRKVIFRM